MNEENKNDSKSLSFIGRYSLNWIVILVVVISINVTMLQATFGNIWLSPDSGGYLAYSSYRSVGYPIILKMFGSIFGELRLLGFFQLNLLLGAFIALGYAVGRLIKNRLAGGILTLLSVGILPLLLHSFFILTEATFTAFLCLHFASVALYFKKPSPKYGILSGITLTIAMLIRPIGYILIAGVVIALLLLPKHRKLTLLCFAVPILVGVLLANAISLSTHGFGNRYSFGTMALLTQTTFILQENDGKGTEHEELIHQILEKNQTLLTKVKNSSYPREYRKNSGGVTYDTILYENNWPIITGYVRTKYPNHVFYDQLNTVARDVILMGMLSNPFLYAKHVFANYLGTWGELLFFDRKLYSEAFRTYERTKNMLNDAPFHKKYVDPAHFSEEGAIKYKGLTGKTLLDYLWIIQSVILKYPLILLLGICSILALVFVFFKKNNPAAGYIFYAVVLLNLYSVVVSMFQSPIPRYTLPFTPILYSIAFIVIVLLKQARSKNFGLNKKGESS